MNAILRILVLSLALLGTELPLGAQDQAPPTPPAAAPTTSAPAASTQEASSPPASGQAPSSQAPSSQANPTPPLFTSDRLEQLVAPIALYPDALVAQVLMASTYPLE